MTAPETRASPGATTDRAGRGTPGRGGQAAAPPAAALSDLMLRRALLLCAEHDSPVADLLDCAAHAARDGFADVAELLRGVVRLRAGPDGGPHGPAHLAGVGACVAVSDGTGASPIARAVAELTDLLALAARPALPAPAPFLPPFHLPPLHLFPGERCEPELAAVATLSADLLAALSRNDAACLATILGEHRRGLLDEEGCDLSTYASARPVRVLAAAVARNLLRDLLLANAALWSPPYGSAAVLAAAARLRPGGLGPYLTGVPTLIRRAGDVIGLAALAVGEDADAATVARAIVLLSAHLDGHALCALLVELAEAGLGEAVTGIVSGLRVGEQDERVCAVAREAALETEDAASAVHVQRVWTARRRTSGRHWLELAEVTATARDDEQARLALLEARRLEPDDEGVEQRLAAMHAGQFERLYRRETGMKGATRRMFLATRPG